MVDQPTGWLAVLASWETTKVIEKIGEAALH
jgi:hypothetical protein